MAEGDFKNILVGFILFSLFGALILTAVVNMAGDYGKDTSDVVGGSLSLAKFTNVTNNIESNAKALEGSFNSGSVWSVLAGVVVEGIFGIAKNMFLMTLAPFNLLVNIMNDVLGVPVYITSVILGIFIMIIILAIWRLIRIGE